MLYGIRGTVARLSRVSARFWQPKLANNPHRKRWQHKGNHCQQTAHRHSRAQKTRCVQYLREGRIALTNSISPTSRRPEKETGYENADKSKGHVGLTDKRACQGGNA